MVSSTGTPRRNRRRRRSVAGMVRVSSRGSILSLRELIPLIDREYRRDRANRTMRPTGGARPYCGLGNLGRSAASGGLVRRLCRCARQSRDDPAAQQGAQAVLDRLRHEDLREQRRHDRRARICGINTAHITGGSHEWRFGNIRSSPCCSSSRRFIMIDKREGPSGPSPFSWC